MASLITVRICIVQQGARLFFAALAASPNLLRFKLICKFFRVKSCCETQCVAVITHQVIGNLIVCYVFSLNRQTAVFVVVEVEVVVAVEVEVVVIIISSSSSSSSS